MNLVDYKYRKLFKYRPLRGNKAFRGRLGILRALNMYENYPSWHIFSTDLGLWAELPPRSNKQIYEQGLETIPSDMVCYPAKIAHGHIQALTGAQVPIIFYPGVAFEQQEIVGADNHFNCPIVQSYPDVIRSSVDAIRGGQVDYRNPYLNLTDEAAVARALAENFADLGISLEKIQTALHYGYQELAIFKKEIQEKGEETSAMLTEKGQRGIVLSGRLYHLDPEINHGTAEVII